MIQYYVPGFIAYGVMATCFNNLSVWLVVRRETGSLKRVRLAPLPTWIFLAAVFASTLVICCIQVVLLLVIGKVGYNVALPASWGAFVFALVVGAASFTALGVAVSTLIPNQEAGGPVVSVVFFVPPVPLRSVVSDQPAIGARAICVILPGAPHDPGRVSRPLISPARRRPGLGTTIS